MLTRRSIRQSRADHGDEGHSSSLRRVFGTTTLLALPNNTDNYSYLIHDDREDVTVAVDIGDFEVVEKALVVNEWALDVVLTTHRHWDHCLGNADAKKAYSGAVFYGSRVDAPLCCDHLLEDGGVVSVGGLEFEALATPGHTRGHLAFLLRNSQPQQLFSGDLLFTAGAGHMFESSVSEMRASLEKVAALAPSTVLWPGHEYGLPNLRFAASVLPDHREIENRIHKALDNRSQRMPQIPTTLGEESEMNPFLMLQDAELRERLGLRDETDTPDEALHALRKLKNAFK